MDTSGRTTRYAMMKQSRSSSDLPTIDGVEAYVDEYSRAISTLPGQLAPLLGQVQRLDVHFCTSMRALHELRDEYTRPETSPNDRRTILRKITAKLLEMQATSDAKLVQTAEMTAVSKVRVTTLESRVSQLGVVNKPPPVVGGKRFATRPQVRRTYASTPPHMNGDKVVDLISRVSNKRTRRPKQFGSEFVRHSPPMPTTAPPVVAKPPPVARISEDAESESEEEAKSVTPPPRRPPVIRKPVKRRAAASTTSIPAETADSAPTSAPPANKRRRETNSTRETARRSRNAQNGDSSRRTSQRTQQTSSSAATDNNEERWCLCDRVSFGEMIGCDNEHCSIEWFHFECVQLNAKPKGKWFCPNCRGDKPVPVKSLRTR